MIKALLTDLFTKYPNPNLQKSKEETAQELVSFCTRRNAGKERSWLIQLLQNLINGNESTWQPIPPHNREEDLDYTNLLSNLNEYTQSHLHHQGEIAEYIFYGDKMIYFIISFESNKYLIKPIETDFAFNPKREGYPKIPPINS